MDRVHFFRIVESVGDPVKPDGAFRPGMRRGLLAEDKAAMKRDRRPELMDQPDVQPDAHRCALQSLNRANRLLGVDRALLARVEWMVGGRGYSLLDLGAGGGGFLQYAAMRRPPTEKRLLVGLDRSAFAVRCARMWQGGPSSWVVADVLAIPLADPT